MGGDFILRTIYATTRPLFPSGPDAPTYIPAALDFAKYGYLSPKITGAPYFPMGYPLLISIIPKINADHWVRIVQIAQITMSVASIYLLYRAVLNYFKSENLALASALCFALLPAYSVMAGEAMYETLMIFLLLLFILAIGRSHSSARASVAAGIVGGFAIVVHPRVLPLVALGFLYLLVKRKFAAAVLAICSTVIVDLIFLVRNLHLYNSFTLYGAGQVNYNIGHAKPCSSLTCDISQPFLHFSVFKESLKNAYYFLSPVSGSATHGTWFHNLSIFSWLSNHGFSKVAMTVIAVILAIVSIKTLVFGSWNLWSGRKYEVALFTGVFALALFTAFIMHGDSRQRLVVAPLVIPIQLAGVAFLVRKVSSMRD